MDGKEVEAALRASPGLLSEEDDPGVFRLLSGNKTLLVTFRVEGETLTVEANSRERLEMAKATLALLGIQGLSHVRDEVTTQQEMKRRAMSGNAPEREKRELPPEALAIIEEHLEEHYEKWPDTKLQALDGKTPRQAARRGRVARSSPKYSKLSRTTRSANGGRASRTTIQAGCGES